MSTHTKRVLDIKFTRQGLPNDSASILEAEPGKLGIKRCKPGILFIRLQVALYFELAIMM